MIKYLRNEKGFFALIGMLVVLALICFFVYYVINVYFGLQVAQQAGVSGTVSSDNNAPANYKSIISSTRDKVEELNKKSFDQLKQTEGLNK